MSNKKGISDVVTTVLIVLLSVVAVAAVGYFLLPMITKSGAQISQSQTCMNANLEVSSCKNSTATNYAVTVRRGAGVANIANIKLIFTKTDDSTNASINSSIPGELETNLYSVSVTGGAKSVVAAVGISDGKGGINYCSPSQPANCISA